MDFAKLNDWMQVVGIFAVVVSLIFVGFQLKQSQDIAIAGQYQERQSVVIDYYSWQGQSDELVDDYGARHREHLDEDFGTENSRPDRLIGLSYIQSRMRLSIYDNNHLQFESGFMTEESWQPYLYLTKSACSVRRNEGKIMLSHGDQFRGSFRDLCLKFISETGQVTE